MIKLLSEITCRIFHGRTSIIKYQEKSVLNIDAGTEICTTYPENASFFEVDVFQFVGKCCTIVNASFTQYFKRCLIGF